MPVCTTRGENQMVQMSYIHCFAFKIFLIGVSEQGHPQMPTLYVKAFICKLHIYRIKRIYDKCFVKQHFFDSCTFSLELHIVIYHSLE